MARGYRKLGRPTDQRMAMLRALVTALLDKEHIETTVTRALEARRLAERLITMAKAGGLANYRRALGILYDESVAKKLFDQIGPRYRDRAGGYTRIVRTVHRRGDAAPMARLELV